MPTPKLFVRHYQDNSGKNYMIYRYYDNHLNNYEYQVYELVMSKPVARLLGSPELSNSRQMCDWVWENVEIMDGEYRTGNENP